MKKAILVLAMMIVLPFAGLAQQEIPLSIETVPVDGAKDVAGGVNIVVNFNKTVTNVKVSMKSKDGKDVTGDTVLSQDGFSATFDPFGNKPALEASLRLGVNASYTVEIDADGTKKAISFNTGDLGTPLKKDVAIKGRTYAMDLSGATFEEPPNLFQAIQQMGQGATFPKLLLHVADMSASPAKLSFMTGLACGLGEPREDCPVTDDPAQILQDKTRPTLSFPAAEFKNPFFAIGPQKLAFEVMGFKIEIEKIFMSGVVSPDGSYIGEGRLEGTIDLKKLLASAGGAATGMDAESVCGLVQTLTGRECIACEDGSTSCLLIRMTNIMAKRTPKAEPLAKVEIPAETKTP